MKNSFVLYTEINEVLKELTNEEKGIIFQAILDYQISGEAPTLPKDLKLFFITIKTDLDKNNAKYLETVEKRKEAGRKGGEAKGSKSKQNVANLANAKNGKQNVANLANVANLPDNDNDNVNDNVLLVNNNKNNNNKTNKTNKTTLDDVFNEIPVELHDTVNAFIEHRKKLKRPVTAHALGLLLKRANTLASGDTAKVKAVLEQSIECGWLGVFELKGGQSNKWVKALNDLGGINERINDS